MSPLALYIVAALREAGIPGWEVTASSQMKVTLSNGADTLQVDAMFSGWRITGPAAVRGTLYGALPRVYTPPPVRP